MSKMKKKGNWTAKVLALVIAIFLWSFVMGEVNPEITANYKINVEIVGKDKLSQEDLVILEPEELKIPVVVAGQLSELEKFDENKIVAKVDVGDLSEGKHNIPIKIESLDGPLKVRLTEYQKEAIFVIDRMIQENREIVFEPIDKLQQDYIIGDVVIEPSTVSLYGPKSYIEKIDKVLARVDVSEANESFTDQYPIELLDVNNKEIEGIRRVSKKPNMVNVTVPISKNAEVPVEIVTMNELPEEYKIKEMKIEPSYVAIKVKSGDGVNKIETKPIDLLSLIGSDSAEVKLNVPENVELINAKEKFVLKYEIEEIGSKTYSFEYGELEFRNVPENLDVKLENTEGFINVSLNIAYNDTLKTELKPYIDLGGLQEGVHEVEIKIDGIPNDGVKFINPTSVKVNLTEITE